MDTSLLGLLRFAPGGVSLLRAVQKAMNGDQEAMAYLKDQGWADVLDLLYRPGTGTVVKNAVDSVKDYVQGNVIEGEFREVSSPPWTSFVKWLQNVKWGAFVILGPKGEGKTMLALRLAQVWQKETGYQCLGVNLYPDDIEGLPFIRQTGIVTFSKTMSKLTRILEGPPEEEEETDDEPVDLESMKRKIVIIDEASLVLHPGGVNSGRMTARRAMAQARHLEWLVIYIGQLCQQMPMDLLLAEAVFVKRPHGWEAKADRQEILVQDIWEAATLAHSRVKGSPYYGEWPDGRAWSYVDCKSPRYSGLMPSSMPVREE